MEGQAQTPKRPQGEFPSPRLIPSSADACVDNPFPQGWSHETSYATRADRIVCVLVGLPGRGKSYISRRLSQYLSFFYSTPCKVFCVGDYRRKATRVMHQPASFFDKANEVGNRMLKQANEEALADLVSWMAEASLPKRRKTMHGTDNGYISGGFGAAAMLDGDYATVAQRRVLIEKLRAETGAKIILIEAICTDEGQIERSFASRKVINENYMGIGMKEALADFKARAALIEQDYETITEKELSWIKLVDGTQITMNNIRGFLPSRIAQFLMNLHLERRPFYFTRHGQSEYNRLGKIGGDSDLTEHGEEYATALAAWVKENVQVDAEGRPQPTRLWTSSLQRTISTARHIEHEHIVQQNGQEYVQMRPKRYRNLDELYAGLCDGMTYEEIAAQLPEEARARKADKFEYRYPRGESYTDLIARLEPMAHELERLTEPIVVVAHQAILRVLYAYFMEKPRETCPDCSIPLNTVIKLTPTAAGCMEERFVILRTPGVELDPASH